MLGTVDDGRWILFFTFGVDEWCSPAALWLYEVPLVGGISGAGADGRGGKGGATSAGGGGGGGGRGGEGSFWISTEAEIDSQCCSTGNAFRC